MSSSKLVLIFLGIILVVIVILTSNRIAAFLKSRFGNLVPPVKFSAVETTPTPTLSLTPTIYPTGTTTKGGLAPSPTTKSTPAAQIPSTGPMELAYVLIGGSAAAGFILTRISSK
ncbi:hypothetical protein A3D77_01240 [Candidatus Gottesmanbacteria bacterium RIFCSPHIGHO2_02_FULL_39_11]|uniref:Uncharacterized protein n=1 Tax=Candidatus Gottesmanbacteria bacterium RIFCSPHIGHO2_02_FULL_39_11 TaxID=1798382 RepID=A0A1F5ZTH5_9BACT|nr:MAG: hypothetical protein A3D77_01240 [Candidatus Gottesmanbacteria bacterium RIFCSPHIGHO2_02_FULL_39_11]